MLSSMLVLTFLPIMGAAELRSTKYRAIYRTVLWTLAVVFLGLGWLGQKPVEDPYAVLGFSASAAYLILFLIGLPIIACAEEYVNSRVYLRQQQKPFWLKIL